MRSNPPTIYSSLHSLHQAFLQQQQQTADSVIKEVSAGSIMVVASIIISFWLPIKAQCYVGITTFHHSCYLIFGISCKCNRINENGFLEIAFIVACRIQRRAPYCKNQMKITSHSPKRNESICKSSLLSVPCHSKISSAPLLATLAVCIN